MNGREQDGDSMNRSTLGIKPDAVTLLAMAGATNKTKTILAISGLMICTDSKHIQFHESKVGCV